MTAPTYCVRIKRGGVILPLVSQASRMENTAGLRDYPSLELNHTVVKNSTRASQARPAEAGWPAVHIMLGSVERLVL